MLHRKGAADLAADVQEFGVTIPAGTAASARWSTPLTMPPRTVRRIEILVPPGSRGVMGFALGAAGTPVIPSNAGGWIVTDRAELGWDLEDQINSGAWECFGYNTGTYDHSLRIRFLLDLVDNGMSTAYRQPLAL